MSLKINLYLNILSTKATNTYDPYNYNQVVENNVKLQKQYFFIKSIFNL